MSLVMGLVNLVSIPAESDDIVTQVDGSHFSRLAWPTMQPSMCDLFKWRPEKKNVVVPPDPLLKF